MKYRATISLEFDAFDHPELSQRTDQLIEWLKEFEQRFGPATLVVKERRPRSLPRAPAPAQIWAGGEERSSLAECEAAHIVGAAARPPYRRGQMT